MGLTLLGDRLNRMKHLTNYGGSRIYCFTRIPDTDLLIKSTNNNRIDNVKNLPLLLKMRFFQNVLYEKFWTKSYELFDYDFNFATQRR